MSVKCEQHLDEFTVQVWLLYDHPNFKYCTLFISRTELRTNGQTDGGTDRRSKHYMPPADLSGRGHKNLLATGKWRQKIHLPTQEIYFPDKSWKKINSEYLIPCLPNMEVVLIIFAMASSCRDKEWLIFVMQFKRYCMTGVNMYSG